MRVFKPNDPLDPTHLRIDNTDRGHPARERSGSAGLGMIIAAALVMILGLLIWGMFDGRQRVAANASAVTTTDSSTPPAPATSR